MKKTTSGFSGNKHTPFIALCLKLILPFSLIVIFLLCARLIPAGISYEYKDADKSTFRTSEKADEVTGSLFVLRENGDKIGVYSSDGTHLQDIDINIGILPEYDRRLLAEGVVAEPEELSELIFSLLSEKVTPY